MRITTDTLIRGLMALVVLQSVFACQGEGDDAGEAVEDGAPSAPEAMTDDFVGPAVHTGACEYNVADGAVVDEDGRVTAPDGSSFVTAPCNRTDKFEGTSERALSAASTPTLNGWVTSAHKQAGTWYRSLSATWKVPPAPSHRSNQWIAMFPGLQDTMVAPNTILQPCLLWNNGLPTWSISPAITTPTKVYYGGGSKQVFPGDTIVGSVQGVNCTAAGVCDWVVSVHDVTRNITSSVTHHYSKPMKWAFGAVLEVGNITRCDEMPNTTSDGFSSIAVYRPDHTVSPTSWILNSPSHVVHCSFGTTSTGPGNAKLHWAP
jgi:hypothetical protein